MTITIGKNIASLRSSRILNSVSENLANSYTRLATGQRINKASDDAAGLAIASDLNTKERIFSVAVRNINDGISYLSIADSAIENMSGILIRLQELAEQSANGIYSSTQRAALDQEAQALSDEYSRIRDSTEFNGKKILDGSNANLSIQAGIGENAVLQTQIGGAIADGTFASPVSVAGLNESIDFAVTDFNNDGLLDVATGDIASDSIIVLTGAGNGTFSGSATLSSSDRPINIKSGDFNNDGNIDLVASFEDDTFKVALGNGDGTFATPSVVTMLEGANSSFELLDFNSDGITDIYSIEENGSYVLYDGNGDGTFNGFNNDNLTSDSVRSSSNFDFDNDGDLDIFVGTSTSLLVVENNGDGTFSTHLTIGATSEVTSVAFGDFNNDGLSDLIVANNQDNRVEIFTGNSTSYNTSIFASTNVGSSPNKIETLDFNQDGNLDFIVSDTVSRDLRIFEGNGDGTFSINTTFFTNDYSAGININDFTGDGINDILVLEASESLKLIEANSDIGIDVLAEFSILSAQGARDALDYFKSELNDLNTQRGKIGSFQKRIEIASNVLLVQAENFKQAESSIRDSDIAYETSNSLRLSILQKSATAVLAQANQQPVISLQLLI